MRGSHASTCWSCLHGYDKVYCLRNDLVVPRGRADLLTALLVELMGDPERRMRMGQSARSRMQAQFSMSLTVDRYAQQILKLLA